MMLLLLIRSVTSFWNRRPLKCSSRESCNSCRIELTHVLQWTLHGSRHTCCSFTTTPKDNELPAAAQATKCSSYLPLSLCHTELHGFVRSALNSLLIYINGYGTPGCNADDDDGDDDANRPQIVQSATRTRSGTESFALAGVAVTASDQEKCVHTASAFGITNGGFMLAGSITVIIFTGSWRLRWMQFSKNGCSRELSDSLRH